jgi:nucleoside-diphosphate-sugar epimerase
MSTPSEQTLLITGATGFIGQHVLQQALSRGYNVRATVRSDKSKSKLPSEFDSAISSGQLTFASVSDITVAANYEQAFKDTTHPITGILHLASPFSFDVTDMKKDLLDPALDGTRAILEAAVQYGQGELRRIVITSSFAAIVDLKQGYRPGYTYSEKDWFEISYDEAAKADASTAYCASKSLAEKLAWDFVRQQKPSFDLTTIAPAWVFGPHVGGLERGVDFKSLNASSATLATKLLDQNEIPPIDFGAYGDVRDVALAHILAFEKSEAGGERFLVSNHFDYQAGVDALREALPEIKTRVPEGRPGAIATEKEVYQVDGSKAERVLGVKYRSLGETMRDSFLELLESETGKEYQGEP